MKPKAIKVNFKMPPETAAEKLYRKHQELRKKRGAPDPEEYKKMAAQKQKEIDALRNEEAEQLDELSKDTLKSYIGKATKDMAERKRQQDISTRRSEQPKLQGKYGQKSSMRTAERHAAAAKSRAVGIGKAAIKFAEETEQLDEMPESSMKTRDVHSHLKKAGWAIARTGGGHDIYSHPQAKRIIAVPRHKQLKAPLIKGILKASKVSEETEIDEQLEKKGRFVSGPPKKTFKAPTIVSPIKEAKDAREYDYEGDMATSQLRSLIFNAEDLIDLLDDNTNLPEWVQSKITLAEDYISTAANYLRGELTESVQIDEAKSKEDLSQYPTERLHAYVKKVSGGGVAAFGSGARLKRVHAEIKRRGQNAPMTKEEVELTEGRPSQRHPLEGHEYHKKTDAELEYIGKDAHKAAEAMKGHNTTAENKYRDQANDAATVRYFRKKSGTPDWYKKKYGHVKEEVEYLEEKNAPTNPSLWSKAKSLARSKFDVYPSAYANGWAAKWYKSKGGGWKTVNEEADEPSMAARTLSRKAQIVKMAAKSKKEEATDKFQKDPELSSDIQKT